MSEYSVALEEISPEVAKELLRANTTNRKVRATHVKSLSSTMLAGQWLFNGDSIKFYKDGALADGQHRLEAIAMSGVTLKTLVVRGLAADVKHTLDIGKRRTLADYMHMSGYSQPNVYATILPWVWRLMRGETSAISTRKGVNVPYSVLADLLVHFPELINMTSFYWKVRKITTYCASITALAAVAGLQNPDKAAEFEDALVTGMGFWSSGDPRYVLREKLISFQGLRDRPEVWVPLGLTIKSWNKFRKGTQSKRLSLGREKGGLELIGGVDYSLFHAKVPDLKTS